MPQYYEAQVKLMAGFPQKKKVQDKGGHMRTHKVGGLGALEAF